MSGDEILNNLIKILKQNGIKKFSDIATLNVDLNKIPGNEHKYGFRSLFGKINTKIEDDDDTVLTIRLCFLDNYKNVIMEMLRQTEESKNI